MFSKRLCVAFLALALSSLTAEGAPHHLQNPTCTALTTIIKTVTVTAGGLGATPVTNGIQGTATTKATTSVKATTNLGNNNGGVKTSTKAATTSIRGGNGGQIKTTSSTKAAATTVANNNNAGNGGQTRPTTKATTTRNNGAQTKTTSSTQAAVTTTARNNNNGGNGAQTKTTSLTKAATTTARNNNGGNGGQIKTTSSAQAITSTTARNNNGGNGGQIKTTSSAQAVTTARNNNGGNGGQNQNTSTKATSTTVANNNGGGQQTSVAPPAVTTAINNGGANAGNNAGNNNGGNNNGGNNGGDPQTSTTLDPRVIAAGFANDGQDQPAAGQVRSLTSTNNFINFCLTVPNLPITNGKQITTGSCNPAPIGAIPSVDNMPSAKFIFPQNFGTVKANTAFTIEMAIKNIQAGFFVNAQSNYFAAPQQLNGQGQIQGHSHVVVEPLTSLDQTTPTDPKKFVFFKGLNAPAAGGKLTADVTSGLPVGVYRLASINTASNHQPVIVPIAQHGSLDDHIYFTVTADGKPAAGANNGAAGIVDTVSAPASSATASVPASSVSVSVSATASAPVSTVAPSGAAASSVASSAPAASSSATGKAGQASATPVPQKTESTKKGNQPTASVSSKGATAPTAVASSSAVVKNPKAGAQTTSSSAALPSSTKVRTSGTQKA